MNLGKSLSQEGGNQSTNLQGQSINIHNGITYSDAKEIALDVFNNNFLKLSQSAANVAKERAEELVDIFLKKISEKDSQLIESVRDPDMQHAIYTAQKEYARSGEKDLEDILTDILVERAGETTQSIKRVSLNESLSIAPKLTGQHLDILSLIFLIKESQNNAIRSRAALKEYIVQVIMPFVEVYPKADSICRHLQFIGCCSSSVGLPQNQISAYFMGNYGGLFSKGFTIEDLTNAIGEQIDLNLYVKPCLTNLELYQLKALNSDELKTDLKPMFDKSTIDKINSFFKSTTMSMDEITNYLVEINSTIESLVEYWRDTNICSMTLTSVGVMLAIMNIKRKIGTSIDSSIWLAD